MKDNIPQIVYQTSIMKKFNLDGTHKLLHVEYSAPYIDRNGYDELKGALYEWNDMNDASFLVFVDNALMNVALQKADAVFFADYPDDYFGWVSRKVKSYRIDSKVVSLRSEINIDLHETPKTSTYEGVTFDTMTGKTLELSDILTDLEIFKEEAEKYLKKKIIHSGENNKMPSNYEETLASIWAGKPLWYLDAEGITFIFNFDEECPYKDTVFVKFPYRLFEKYFRDGYGKMGDICVAQATVRPFDEGSCIILTRSGELKAATLMVNRGDIDISLTLQDRKTEVGVMDCIGKLYFLRLPGGREFLLLSADYSSFDSVTLLFEIANGEVVMRSQLDGANLQTGSINTDKLTVDVEVHAFGSYSAIMNYMISEENGELTRMDDVFRIEENDQPYYLLTVKNDLPVTINGTKTKLPIGSQIRITGTDNRSVAYFRIENTSTEGYISFRRFITEPERKEPVFVNSLPDFIYFENLLPYRY